jgi:hypothetical protein
MSECYCKIAGLEFCDKCKEQRRRIQKLVNDCHIEGCETCSSLQSQLTTALDQLEKAKKALRTIAHSSNHDKYSNIEGCCYSTCLACLAASTLKELEK